MFLSSLYIYKALQKFKRIDGGRILVEVEVEVEVIANANIL
jgi:hypothetical protein